MSLAPVAPVAPVADTVTVHLRSLPVSLAAKAAERREELLCAFALISADLIESRRPETQDEVPTRLLDLVVSLAQQLAELPADVYRRFEGAMAGCPVIDHVVEWPSDLAGATRALADLFDEADRYCWTRDDLIPLATPPDCAAYRRWVFAQILDQIDGRGPVPWPESAAARGL